MKAYKTQVFYIKPCKKTRNFLEKCSKSTSILDEEDLYKFSRNPLKLLRVF